MNKIIIVLGMCGAGKSVLCDYLETKGFERIYFGAITFEKLKEEGLEATPENERMMREKLRKKHGMAVFATLNLPKIKDAIKNGNVVLESLYSWDELNIILKEFKNQVVMISVIVNKELRYERLNKRIIRPFNKDEAIERDITEIENIAKAGAIVYADYFLDNNGSIDDLYKQMDKILNKINA